MEQRDLIDLTEYFDRIYKAIKKLWKICLAFILLFAFLNVVKSLFTYHPTYTSTMSVIVSEQGKNILVTSDDANETNLAFQKALTSNSMYKIIQSDLNMSYVPATLSITLVNNTNFMNISATSSNPEDAYRVIQSVASNYAQLTTLMNDAKMIIIEDAQLPTSPNSRLNYFQLLIKGALMGVGLSLVIVLGYALSRRTIIKEEHIKDKLHLKSFGCIPNIKNKKRSYMQEKQLLVDNVRIPWSYKESYRSIALKLERITNMKVLMVTSTLPNEGKSTVSSNIALTLAQKGKRIVLVDFDLRNPSLYNTYRIENTKDNIGNYLDGTCMDIEDIICPSEKDERLDLILGFNRYSNSIEMLSRNTTKKLIDELKERYDYVILDVPPLFEMHDALQVAKYADKTLLVIRQDVARVYEIVEALDEFYEVSRNICGCVLNAQDKSLFDADARGYGYGYTYGK
ncbi:MAG: polysaccharide biosynthesis tyrosine autokinase [Traorella sp.]